MPTLKAASENRYSWRLRFAVAENAAQLSQYLTKAAVEDEILGFYELLLRDSEPEVRSEAVAQVPLVARYCTSSVFVERILPIIKDQIANDASQHVKGSMASAICEMAQALSPEETVTYIIPTVSSILKEDSATEVRVSLLENLSKLVGSLSEAEIVQLIIPEIERLSQDKTWRVRLATIRLCPGIPSFLSREVFSNTVEPILLKWLEDSVHQVRMETISCLVKLKE